MILALAAYSLFKTMPCNGIQSVLIYQQLIAEQIKHQNVGSGHVKGIAPIP